MPRPYMPSNGTEGCAFEARFCERCLRDKECREKQSGGCDILMNALCAIPPAEWIQDDDGDNPRCTAFEPEGGE